MAQQHISIDTDIKNKRYKIRTVGIGAISAICFIVAVVAATIAHVWRP